MNFLFGLALSGFIAVAFWGFLHYVNKVIPWEELISEDNIRWKDLFYESHGKIPSC